MPEAPIRGATLPANSGRVPAQRQAAGVVGCSPFAYAYAETDDVAGVVVGLVITAAILVVGYQAARRVDQVSSMPSIRPSSLGSERPWPR